MSVRIQRQARPPWTLLSIGGDLDVLGAPELRQGVVTALNDGIREMILDVSELDFVDSFGIGVIVGALKRVRQRGGELLLVCPAPRIRRVFELCDLDRIFVLHDSVEEAEATASVSSPTPA